MTTLANTSAPRAVFLDWLRIIALGLLVPYHVGMYYVSGTFHVKSSTIVPLLEPFMRLTSPWRMSLLFAVSGAATTFMLARRPADGAWLRQRAARLLLPLLAGMLVVVPPQAYFEAVQKHGYAGGFLDFMRLYLTGYGGFCAPGGGCLMLPTWNHLWFLPYLAAYTLLLWLAVRRVPGAIDRGGAWLERLLAGARLMWLPVLVFWLLRITLGWRFPTTHAFVDDPYTHLQHGAMFAFGVLAARRGALWQRFEAWRWPALLAALLAWALWAVAFGSAPPSLQRSALVSVQQWAALVAAFGFAHRHLRHDGPWRARLTEAVFPVYVLHQTLIVVLAMALAPPHWPPAIEGPLIAAATLLLAWCGYEGLRRIAPLRPWFGIAPRHRAAAAAPAPAPIRSAARRSP